MFCGCVALLHCCIGNCIAANDYTFNEFIINQLIRDFIMGNTKPTNLKTKNIM